MTRPPPPGVLMFDEPKQVTLPPSTNVAIAYAADVARVGRGSISAHDDVWIILAHALGRFGFLSDDELRESAAQTADALAVNALAIGLARDSMILRAACALRMLHGGTGPVADTTHHGAVTELVVATQSVVADQELSGAFELAYATLHGLLSAFGALMPPRMRGNVLSQQGRAVRQLGVMDVARDLYQSAIDLGYESDALDVVSRALNGMAVIALTRGNYPLARKQFELALANAVRANDPDLIRHAHHGLFNCGFTSGDLDAAMVHGWNVLRLCIAPDSRAEALMNMAEICRLTGEHDAAMRVYAVTIEWSSQPRVRLHAMSGALQSAIAVGRIADAHRYAEGIDALLPTVPDTYTRASVGIEVADSLHRLGNAQAATTRLTEAKALAVENSFHELVHRAEQASSVWHVPALPVEQRAKEGCRKKPHRSEDFRTVLRSLNGLTAAAL